MDDLHDIARRLVAHPRWEWREGMLCDERRRVLGFCHDGAPYWELEDVGPGPEPDLTDWATTGVLLGMLAEAVPSCSLTGNPDGTWWVESEGWDLLNQSTPGAAVALALLEAWGD